MHTLRELPSDLNPLYRIDNFGAGVLSNQELVAILLGDAPNCDNPVEIAECLIAEHGGVAYLARLPLSELMRQNGIGIGRARRLASAFELAKRINSLQPERLRIRQAEDMFTLLSDMQHLEQEQLRVVLLNRKKYVMQIITVYKGSVHTTVIRIAEVLRDAIRWNASEIVLAHNHPSTDPSPSPEDVAVTREIARASALMDIELLDHIIVGQGRFVSLREMGLGF